MMEQRPFRARMENRIQLESCLGKNQEIMMEQNPFPEQRKQRKKSQEGTQKVRRAPEPGGTRKS